MNSEPRELYRELMREIRLAREAVQRIEDRTRALVDLLRNEPSDEPPSDEEAP